MKIMLCIIIGLAMIGLMTFLLLVNDPVPFEWSLDYMKYIAVNASIPSFIVVVGTIGTWDDSSSCSEE